MNEPVRHTPGPWHPGHLGSDGKCQCRSVCDEGYAGGICTVHVGNGLPIGDGGNDAPPRDEAVANMYLIAAAPDLLAALEAVMAEWREGYGLQCVDQVRAAIAKAHPSRDIRG